MAGSRAVRPRLIWSGLALALAGCVVIAVGLIVGTLLLWSAGIAVTAVGLAVGAWGGALRDASTTATFGDEMHHLVTGETRDGVSPGLMIRTPAALEDAVSTARRTAHLTSRPLTGPVGPYDAPAGWALLFVAAAVLWMQWGIGGTGSVTRRVDSLRDVGLVVVLALAGLRCVVGNGSHHVAGWVATATGALLLAQGVFAAHETFGRSAVEVMAGIAALVAGVAVGVWSRASGPGGRSRQR